MDEIRIEDLEIFSYHGITQKEQEKGQIFTINAVLHADLRVAGTTDQLEQTIDHGQVCRFIAKFMRSRTYRLLETVAERLSEEILLSFPKVEAVDLSIRKQNDREQVELPVGSVSVSLHRSWHTVYLSFSSNYGDRKAYINQGIVLLKQLRHCRVEQYSDVYESGNEDNLYYSGALKLRTLYMPCELRDALTHIEERTGRIPNDRRAPRTLDLDILFFDDEMIQSRELCIPHPDLENRDYVLVPLSQIAGFKRHPATGESVRQMADRLKERRG